MHCLAAQLFQRGELGRGIDLLPEEFGHLLRFLRARAVEDGEEPLLIDAEPLQKDDHACLKNRRRHAILGEAESAWEASHLDPPKMCENR